MTQSDILHTTIIVNRNPSIVLPLMTEDTKIIKILCLRSDYKL